MAADIPMNFDYGDSVELVDEKSSARFGISRGSVCGLRILDGVQSIMLGFEEGTQLVLVEAEDGTSAEVPSHLLRRFD